MSVQRLLQQEGKSLYLLPADELKKQLKFLLCPVLVNSQEQRKLFYIVFDQYWDQYGLKEVRHQKAKKAQASRHSASENIQKDNLPPWLVWSIVGACIALGLGLLIFGGRTTHPIPEAHFTLINGGGGVFPAENRDSLIRKDTFEGRGLIGDTLKFVFSPGEEKEDTLGMGAAELIWTFGDGHNDTIRNPDSFFDTMYYVYEVKNDYLVRLRVRHPRKKTEAALQGEEKVSHAKITLGCPNPPKANIRWTPIEAVENQELQFLRPADSLRRNDYFIYTWDFGDGTGQVTGATPTHRYLKAGDYRAHVTAIRVIPSRFACRDTARATKYISVNSEAPKKLLATHTFPLKRDDSAVPVYTFTRFSIGLMAVGSTLLLLLIGLWIRIRTYRSPIEEQDKNEFEGGEDGPYTIPLPKQDHLIAPDKGIYDLAKVMRQRLEGNIQTVNLPVSIQKTIRESGLPILHFNMSSRPSEYLILIEQYHPESHLARFFGRITEILKEQDVLLETFYYDDDPRICWNEEHPDGLNLEYMRQRYAKHRLILFSTGHHLINPSKPVLYQWVVPELEAWRENRILLTPTPVVDWDYREKLIMQEMDVLPLDIPGQMYMMEMFDEIGQPDFDEHRKRMETLFPAAKHSANQYDLFSVQGLKDYLQEALPSNQESSHLLHWLAATTIYPQPAWEVTLAVGHALSQSDEQSSRKNLLTFENLLTLARIPWLQTNNVPSALRQELLGSLDAETERKGREAILGLLDQVDVEADSFASTQLAVQKVSNQFFLDPWKNDEASGDIAKKMYYLIKEDLLEDTELRKRLDEPTEILDNELNQAPTQYLDNHFGLLRQREYLIGGISGLLILSLLSFLLFHSFGKIGRNYSWLEGKDVDESIWFNQYVDQDSALVFHNQAVDFAKSAELDSATQHMRRAIEFRQADSLGYPLAENNLSRLYYRLGAKEFNEHERTRYTTAIHYFDRVPFGSDTVALHSLGASAMAHFYLDSIQPSITDFLALLKLNQTFATEEFPVLYSALLDKAQDSSDVSALTDGNPYRLHIELAKYFLRDSLYRKAISHADSALVYQAEDSMALAFKESALASIEQDNYQLASEIGKGLANQKDKKEKLTRIAGKCPTNEEEWSLVLSDFAESLEKDSIYYTSNSADALADVSGIFHRMARYVKSICPDYPYPNPVQTRHSRSIVKWYHDQNHLSIVQDPMASRNLIKPGSVMFYGQSGKKYTNISIEQLSGTSQARGMIAHMGVVTEVRKDENGNVTGYVLMRSHRPGRIASRSDYHDVKPPRASFPVLGNWNQQWVAIAQIVPSIPSDQDRIKNTLDSFNPFKSKKGDPSQTEDPKTESKSELETSTPTSLPSLDLPSLPSATGCFSSDAALSRELTRFAEQLETQKIMYTQSPPSALADNSGIFFRIAQFVAPICPNYAYPDATKTRDSRSIAKWYHDTNNLVLVQDPMKTRNLIRPGSVMFYGGPNAKYSNLTIELMAGTPGNRGAIFHMGVVTEVIKDDQGNVTGYVLMHAKSAGKTAGRTYYHKIEPPRLGYPILGNWNMQWVAIANIMTPQTR